MMQAPNITTVTTYAAILYTFTLPALLLIAALGFVTLNAIPQAWFGLYASTIILTVVKWVGTKVWKAVKDTVREINPDVSTK